MGMSAVPSDGIPSPPGPGQEVRCVGGRFRVPVTLCPLPSAARLPPGPEERGQGVRDPQGSHQPRAERAEALGVQARAGGRGQAPGVHAHAGGRGQDWARWTRPGAGTDVGRGAGTAGGETRAPADVSNPGRRPGTKGRSTPASGTWEAGLTSGTWEAGLAGPLSLWVQGMSAPPRAPAQSQPPRHSSRAMCLSRGGLRARLGPHQAP